MKSTRTERAGALVIAGVVLAFTLATQLLGGPTKGVPGSVASAAPDGRRALFLLFEALGYAPEAWRKFPGALPRGEHVLWLAQAPPAAHASAEADADDTATDVAPARSPNAALEFRSLANYGRFVEEGGTLVLPAGRRALEFLVRDLACEPCREIALDDASPAGLRRVHTSIGAQWNADWKAGATFARPDPASDVSELWWGGREGGAEDELFALLVQLGSGRIVVLGDDAFLDNARLGQEDHALLAVALFEEISRGGRLVFDEYALGLWEASTPIGLATGPNLALASAHVLLFLVLVVWRAAWVARFPRDPVPLAQGSPIMRARALAGLLERAGRQAALARLLRSGVLRRLRVKVRLAPDRDGHQDGAAALAEIARRAGLDAAVVARWQSVFAQGAGPLEALGRELAAIETEVDATVSRASSSHRPAGSSTRAPASAHQRGETPA